MGDVLGLYLLVTPNGSTLWRYDYVKDSKRRAASPGSYPAVMSGAGLLDLAARRQDADGRLWPRRQHAHAAAADRKRRYRRPCHRRVANETGLAARTPVVAVLSGGGSRSKLWPQIFADVLSVPVTVAVSRETGALGAAIAAGTGVGLFPISQKARPHGPRRQAL